MFPLTDSIDHDILMHRNAHFGGQFIPMLQYYEKEGKGIQADFELDRIRELTLLEKDMQKDLGELILLDEEKEEVKKSLAIYEALKKSSKGIPKLIADLILSEEEYPTAAMEALVQEKEKALDPLLDLLKTEHFHNPLFPGYALAPQLAAECLGQIGHKKAIITLFESIAQGDFFDDEAAITALQAIGEPARDFLLRVLHAKPFTLDNDRAAIALVAFKDDPLVASEAFKLLLDPDFAKEEAFLGYLILVCEGLKEERDAFKDYAKRLPKNLQKDAEAVIKLWN